MFALLAMAGDLGGSIGPAIVGRVADMFGGSIHVGMRIGPCFRLRCVLCYFLFKYNETTMRISRNSCYVHVTVKCCQMKEHYGEKNALKETNDLPHLSTSA